MKPELYGKLKKFVGLNDLWCLCYGLSLCSLFCSPVFIICFSMTFLLVCLSYSSGSRHVWCLVPFLRVSFPFDVVFDCTISSSLSFHVHFLRATWRPVWSSFQAHETFSLQTRIWLWSLLLSGTRTANEGVRRTTLEPSLHQASVSTTPYARSFRSRFFAYHYAANHLIHILSYHDLAFL